MLWTDTPGASTPIRGIHNLGSALDAPSDQESCRTRRHAAFPLLSRAGDRVGAGSNPKHHENCQKSTGIRTCDGAAWSLAVALEEHVAVRGAKEATERSSGLTSRLPAQQSIQRARSGSIDIVELDASTLQPIVGHALDAFAVPVDWSVVPILAWDGQGLGVFRVSGSARLSGEPRAWSVILNVLPTTPLSPTRWNHPARGDRLRTRPARRPTAGSRGAAVLRSRRARRPASGVARRPRLGRDSLAARRLWEGGASARPTAHPREGRRVRFEVAAPRAAGATRDCQFRRRRCRTAPRTVGLQ